MTTICPLTGLPLEAVAAQLAEMATGDDRPSDPGLLVALAGIRALRDELDQARAETKRWQDHAGRLGHDLERAFTAPTPTPKTSRPQDRAELSRARADAAKADRAHSRELQKTKEAHSREVRRLEHELAMVRKELATMQKAAQPELPGVKVNLGALARAVWDEERARGRAYMPVLAIAVRVGLPEDEEAIVTVLRAAGFVVGVLTVDWRDGSCRALSIRHNAGNKRQLRKLLKEAA